MCILYVRRYLLPVEPYIYDKTKLVICKNSSNKRTSCVNVPREERKQIQIGTPKVALRGMTTAEQTMREADMDAEAAFARLASQNARIVEPPPSLVLSSNATATSSMPSTPRSIPHSPTRFGKGRDPESPTIIRPGSSRRGAKKSSDKAPLISQPNPPSYMSDLRQSYENSGSSKQRRRLPGGVSARTRQHNSDSEYEFGFDNGNRPSSSSSSAQTAIREVKEEETATEVLERGRAREELRKQERERQRESEARRREQERKEALLDQQELRTQGRLDARERMREEARERQRRQDALRQEQEDFDRQRRQRAEDEQTLREKKLLEQRLLEKARENLRLRELRDQRSHRVDEEERLRLEQERRRLERDQIESELRYQQRLEEMLQQQAKLQTERNRTRDALAAADETARQLEEERAETEERIRKLDQLAQELRDLKLSEHAQEQKKRAQRDHEDRHRPERHRRDSSNGSNGWPWTSPYFGDSRHYHNSSRLHHQPPPPPPPPPAFFGDRRRLPRPEVLDDSIPPPFDMVRPPSSQQIEDPEFRRLRGQEVLLDRASRRNAALADPANDPRISVPFLTRRNTISGQNRDRETHYRDGRRRYM